MISKSILRRLFVTRAGSIYRFTPKVTSSSLSPTNPLRNNWFVVKQPNRIPLRPMRGWDPLFKTWSQYLREQPLYYR